MQNHEHNSLALFCDFENIALGVKDIKNTSLDLAPVIEHLLIKGSIVVKKAYCDWSRYARYKKAMHSAAFELIDIPHVSQSGKNSADIRMVVDALDLCYTKEHVDTFVIISGDSDFSPLVSKLRENAKTVIGVGVRNSTSELLVRNCDEFIYYEDLVEKPATAARKKTRRKKATRKKAGNDKAQKGIDLVLQTAQALAAERGSGEKLWGSMVKQALKRRQPEFSESHYGFASFSNLLEEARDRELITLELDERSGGYVIASID